MAVSEARTRVALGETANGQRATANDSGNISEVQSSVFLFDSLPGNRRMSTQILASAL